MDPTMTEAPADAGIEICVTCRPDGSFAVSTEPAETAAMEDDGDGGDIGGQPAGSIGEALKLALASYKEWSASSGAGGEDAAMAAGFQGVRGG